MIQYNIHDERRKPQLIYYTRSFCDIRCYNMLTKRGLIYDEDGFMFISVGSKRVYLTLIKKHYSLSRDEKRFVVRVFYFFFLISLDLIFFFFFLFNSLDNGFSLFQKRCLASKDLHFGVSFD